MLEYTLIPGNPFMENTYIIYDKTRECIIVDPGCYDKGEQKRLVEIIEMKCLKPVRLINTHCHIDHVLGNAFVSKRYGLTPEYHEIEEIVMDSCEMVAKNYNIPYELSPRATSYLKEGELIKFGELEMEIRFTPGHSPGSVSLVNHKHNIVFAGDVLFQNSIGRTDLPGGDFPTLEKSIKEQLYTLGDHFVVCSGHGSETTIGHERVNNPFVKG